ncbi:hypothetical protein [Pseudomonas asiatica]|nr:hypothetical protein [Pseudomonas asiatica]
MNLPIALPDGWAAEIDETFGVIITAVEPQYHPLAYTAPAAKDTAPWN